MTKSQARTYFLNFEPSITMEHWKSIESSVTGITSYLPDDFKTNCTLRILEKSAIQLDLATFRYPINATDGVELLLWILFFEKD